MSFKSIFISIFIGTALILAALIINSRRPAVETSQPTAEFIRATGKCAECHRRETAAVVVEFERSRHAATGVNCLDCHTPQAGQQEMEHRGFVIAKEITAKNCNQCHTTEYQQFLRSRHAAPAYAAIFGDESFTAEQVEFAEQFHKGAVKRPANALALLEGEIATVKGCVSCHAVGKPNADGSIGNCTQCHSRHLASVELARNPQTCGQCHMGPDHSQIEIYYESKHGVLYDIQKKYMNLRARSKDLTVHDMPVPTCATCHMSGLEGLKVTHDVTERLSYWLFDPISEKRPTYAQGQAQMKEVCLKCHTTNNINKFFLEAEEVLKATNSRVAEGQEIINELRREGLLTPQPFDEPIEFLAFDFWHYYGRTAKHGAFMGGADFVQWHGNYELLAKLVEIKAMAEELRSSHGRNKK